MNADDFENRMRQQSFRQIPPDWRDGILRAANQAHASRFTFHVSRVSLSTLLWPSPSAWAALAAVWLVILGVHFSLRDKTESTARGTQAVALQGLMSAREQEQLLSELIGSEPTASEERPSTGQARPRSERRRGVSLLQSAAAAANPTSPIRRSAGFRRDFQSAALRFSEGASEFQALQAGSRAIQQVGNLRYVESAKSC